MTEFGTTRTIVVFGIVAACFAVLWPKLFYPIFFAGNGGGKDKSICCDVLHESDLSLKIISEICRSVQSSEETTFRSLEHCKEQIHKKCSVDFNLVHHPNALFSRPNITAALNCISNHFGLSKSSLQFVSHLMNYHANRRILKKQPNIRQERSNSLHDGYLHPAFKEKGSAYYAGGGNEKPPPPVRTIDKELKPGPVPGMRPAFGGGMNHIPQQKGAGSMGILMPLYTIGISVFFLYTITKVLFKKKDTENHQSHFQRDRSAIEETLERSKREVLDSSPFHRKYEPPCVTPPPPKQLANGSDAVLSKGSPTFRENAKLESQAEAALQEQRDFEIYLLKKRLEDTEKALERIFMQMEILSNTISKEIVQRDYYQQPRNSPDKPEPTQEESKEVKLTKAATNDDGAKDEC